MNTRHDDPGRAVAARRRFLRHGARLGFAGLALSPLARLFAASGTTRLEPHAGYGPLRPVRDATSGLPLLSLPDGFSYRTFGWAGEPLDDGTSTPRSHDGMGVVRVRGDIATLVRNHEVVLASGAFGPVASHYDPECAGGAVTLDFHLGRGELLAARASLSGTMQNCAGGTTPWGSWLSCEEFVSSTGVELPTPAGPRRLARDHGFVFEVPADGHSRAEPLLALGQFKHEAATVHAPTGHVYLTEDAYGSAGFYRCIPKVPGELARGGRLQMLAAIGREDLRTGLRSGQRFAVRWVDIEEPARGHDAQTSDVGLVHRQGLAQGGSRFTRLEGCIATDEEIFFTATDGGDAKSGQVFAYYPAREELLLVYESTDPAVLDYPDNVVVSPRGGLVICEDSRSATSERLYGLTRSGALFEFARNEVVLDGAFRGIAGDFRTSEWAGACFSPDGRWLFANVYNPGFSVAITGPWRDGLI